MALNKTIIAHQVGRNREMLDHIIKEGKIALLKLNVVLSKLELNDKNHNGRIYEDFMVVSMTTGRDRRSYGE